ncbi:nuclear nucleic acid-binding protein C1D [Cajanus cajan]|uniref:Nuclear nucleic acid-binding protein C1D n=1 Tax=Cajanus cajan TaxID=3821 RepID=A0A151RNV8_CAJCA|nr:nuclear nucleic acid-binding protein C1D [Cajanus cajan]XP_029131002.1 nuclear nucleic acid-binding protein C1D [Cajanus cajan]KYP44228.1 Nuclear nucleic acid-binding protein C1D [Cajanus cajan]
MVKGSESGAVPEGVMDAVNSTLSNLQQLRTHFQHFLSLSDPQLLSQMPPLQRAHSLFIFSKITSTLLALNVRCSGVHPDDHPVKSELDRLDVYEDKLERLLDLSRAPLRPSTTLNYQAATRFIEHSLPDLTPEQRENMRNISRGERPKMNHLGRAGQKRKYQSSEKQQSVQTAAKEFLEKAARELLGDNSGGIKGPLQVDISEDDDDELPVS